MTGSTGTKGTYDVTAQGEGAHDAREGGSMFFIALGTTLTIGGLTAWLAAEFKVVRIGPASVFQPVCTAISLGGFPLFGLSAAPTNKTAARAFLIFLTVISAVIVLLFGFLSVRFARNCDQPLQMVFLGLCVTLTAIGCVALALFAIAYDKPAKAVVEHCWKVGRGLGVALSVVYSTYACLRLAFDPKCTPERFAGQLVLSFAPMLYAALTGPEARRRVQLWCLDDTDSARLRPTIVPSKPVVEKLVGSEKYPALLPFGHKEDEAAFSEWYARTCADYAKDVPTGVNALVSVEREAALRQSWIAMQEQDVQMQIKQEELEKLQREVREAQTRASNLEALRRQELLARTIRTGVAARTTPRGTHGRGRSPR